MKSEQYPVDERTSAYQESLLPPGESLPATGTEGGDVFNTDTGHDEWAHEERMRRAGYEPEDVSGDTDAVIETPQPAERRQLQAHLEGMLGPRLP